MARRVAEAGGWNRFGEPNYRVVWGWSRLSWIGGEWTDRDASGNAVRTVVELRREPKYFPVDRWHVEKWVPPEAYGGPLLWERETVKIFGGHRVRQLGPYPYRGEYEHCFTVEEPDGSFLQLRPMAVEWIVRAMEWSRRQSAADARASIEEREERKRKAQDAKDDEILGLGFDEPKLKGGSMVTVA